MPYYRLGSSNKPFHLSSVADTEHSLLPLAADVSAMCIPDVCKRLDQSLVSLLPGSNQHLPTSTEVKMQPQARDVTV